VSARGNKRQLVWFLPLIDRCIRCFETLRRLAIAWISGIPQRGDAVIDRLWWAGPISNRSARYWFGFGNLRTTGAVLGRILADQSANCRRSASVDSSGPKPAMDPAALKSQS